MSDKQAKSYLHLAFRIALLTSLAGFPVFAFVFNIHIPLREALQYAFIGSIGMLFVSYFIARRFLLSRFEYLNHVMETLANKEFESFKEGRVRRSDELDDLIIQAHTSLRLTEKEILRLNKLENYRKEFIGDISHELKTPLFAIQGFIETLLDGAIEDPRVNRDFLRKAMRNVNRLTVLTRDLTEISKLETGELRSEFTSFSLAGAVQEVFDGLLEKAANEKITVTSDPIDPEIMIVADRNQLKQVLTNLIDNSIKYNRPEGHVRVGVKKHPKNKSKYLIFVSDTGFGIEESDIPRLTERFFRIEKSRSREKGGTGLGLSIVKHIIEAHGEQLYIESVINKGSVFSFSMQNARKNTVT